MAHISLQKRFEIPKLFDNQAIEGTISTSNTFELFLKDSEGKNSPLNISVNDVEILEDDVIIKYNIVWSNVGPEVFRDENGNIIEYGVRLSNIASAKAKFVKYVKNRNRSMREDFLFRFNTKNGVFDIGIGKYDFVCLLTKVNENEKKRYYGYVNKIEKIDGVDYAIVEEYKSFKGVYSINISKIPVDDILGVFRYRVNLTDFVSKKSAETSEKE